MLLNMLPAIATRDLLASSLSLLGLVIIGFFLQLLIDGADDPVIRNEADIKREARHQ